MNEECMMIIVILLLLVNCIVLITAEDEVDLRNEILIQQIKSNGEIEEIPVGTKECTDATHLVDISIESGKNSSGRICAMCGGIKK